MRTRDAACLTDAAVADDDDFPAPALLLLLLEWPSPVLRGDVDGGDADDRSPPPFPEGEEEEAGGTGRTIVRCADLNVWTIPGCDCFFYYY